MKEKQELASYEEYLRGKKGMKLVLVDIQYSTGSFKNGEHDTLNTWRNLITTLDIDLQEYGEKLMSNKKGIV